MSSEPATDETPTDDGVAVATDEPTAATDDATEPDAAAGGDDGGAEVEAALAAASAATLAAASPIHAKPINTHTAGTPPRASPRASPAASPRAAASAAGSKIPTLKASPRLAVPAPNRSRRSSSTSSAGAAAATAGAATADNKTNAAPAAGTAAAAKHRPSKSAVPPAAAAAAASKQTKPVVSGANKPKTSPAKPSASSAAKKPASAPVAATGSRPSTASSANRAGLLGGITSFAKTKLKKTETNDKSKPAIEKDSKSAPKKVARPMTATTTRVTKPASGPASDGKSDAAAAKAEKQKSDARDKKEKAMKELLVSKTKLKTAAKTTTPTKPKRPATATTTRTTAAAAAASGEESDAPAPTAKQQKMKAALDHATTGTANVSVSGVLAIDSKSNASALATATANAMDAKRAAAATASAEANAAAGVEVAIKFEGAILFCIDISSSMKDKNRWQITMKALRDICTELMARGTMHFFGAMTFNVESDILAPIAPATPASINSLVAAMEKTELEGGTAIYRAVIEANRIAKVFCTAHPVQALTIIVLTDGEDNSSSAAARTNCKETDLYLARGHGVGALQGNPVLLKRCVIGLKTGAGSRLAKNIDADLLGFTAGGVDTAAAVRTHEQYIEQARKAALARAKAEAEARAAAEAKRAALEALAKMKAEAALKAFKDETERKHRALAEAELERQLKAIADAEAAAKAARDGRLAAIQAAADAAAKLVAPPKADTEKASKASGDALHACQSAIDHLEKMRADFAKLHPTAFSAANAAAGVDFWNASRPASNSIDLKLKPTSGGHSAASAGANSSGGAASGSTAAGTGGGGAAAGSTAAKLEAEQKKSDDDWLRLENELAKADAEVKQYQTEVDEYTANPSKGKETTSYQTPGGLGNRSSIKIETTRMAWSKKNLEESKKRRDRVARSMEIIRAKRDAAKKEIGLKLALAAAADALAENNAKIAALWQPATGAMAAAAHAGADAKSSPTAAATTAGHGTGTPAGTGSFGGACVAARDQLSAAMEKLKTATAHSVKSTAKAVASADIIRLLAADPKAEFTDADVADAQAQLAKVGPEAATADRHAKEVIADAATFVKRQTAAITDATAQFRALLEQNAQLTAAHKAAAAAVASASFTASSGSASTGGGGGDPWDVSRTGSRSNSVTAPPPAITTAASAKH